jgi:selenocysteine lyase/cysteine desulfurase
MDKRAFLKGLGLAGLGLPLTGHSMEKMITQLEDLTSRDVMTDESFWARVRKDYLLKPDYINLENGYYNIMPQPTLEKFLAHVKQVNLEGAYYMRTVQYDNKKAMAAKLAALTGCTIEDLIMTRNTTESLDMIIGGYPWQAGDEAVMAEQDYGAMLEMFKQVSRRHGVVNKIISIPNIPSSDEEIVNLYAGAITNKTKLLMVCHMINITGQILPVKKICEMAHSKGVEVLVDGAHAIAHFQYKIPDLGCDYYGASLHWE